MNKCQASAHGAGGKNCKEGHHDGCVVTHEPVLDFSDLLRYAIAKNEDDECRHDQEVADRGGDDGRSVRWQFRLPQSAQVATLQSWRPSRDSLLVQPLDRAHIQIRDAFEVSCVARVQREIVRERCCSDECIECPGA
jgi:hypothetical protein